MSGLHWLATIGLACEWRAFGIRWLCTNGAIAMANGMLRVPR